MESINNRSITSVHNLATTTWKETEITIQNTFLEEVEVYTIYKIATFINNYWFPVLIPIGLVGNIVRSRLGLFQEFGHRVGRPARSRPSKGPVRVNSGSSAS